MRTIGIKKGLNLPISGDPVPTVFDGQSVHRVAVMGPDSVGMRPKFEVEVGDAVKLGQTLFVDKKRPQIRYTSPGAGHVASINRGAKRAFQSIVIVLAGDKEITWKSYADLSGLIREEAHSELLDSGLWTAFRARPFGKVPDPKSVPHAIFVTAMDTDPLAPSIPKILGGLEKEFQNGLIVLSRLTDGNVFVCQAPGEPLVSIQNDRIVTVAFDGPHPAGLPGTHIHFLDPAARSKTVWHIDVQDVIAIGRLFVSGRLWTDRIVSLAGPNVKNPRMMRTRLGASLTDMLKDQTTGGPERVISGSVFAGFKATDNLAFLGRYHHQVSVLPEDPERKLFGWLDPGKRLFSLKRIVLSGFLSPRHFEITTNLHGGLRSIVPSGSYEKVMPLDILPTYLLRALACDDVEEAEKLGALELIEEDLALCSFACPAKIDHMSNLRRCLNLIEKEG